MSSVKLQIVSDTLTPKLNRLLRDSGPNAKKVLTAMGVALRQSIRLRSYTSKPPHINRLAIENY